MTKTTSNIPSAASQFHAANAPALKLDALEASAAATHIDEDDEVKKHIMGITQEGVVVPLDAVLVPTTLTHLQYEDLKTHVKKLKEKMTGISITSNYLEFTEKNKPKRMTVLGYKNIEFKDKAKSDAKMQTRAAVEFMDEDENTWVNASVSLVRSVRNAGLKFMDDVEISFLGKSGDTKLYSVRLLMENPGTTDVEGQVVNQKKAA